MKKLLGAFLSLTLCVIAAHAEYDGTPRPATTASVLLNTLGTSQGSILYRGPYTWGALTPGTSGQTLQTQGAGANPIWANAVSSVGIVAGTSITTSGTCTITTTGSCTINSNILSATDQTLSGGANVTPYSIGSVSSGTTTIDCGKSPLQWMVNTGASTIAVPANDGSCLLEIINGNGAGALTFSNFSGKTSTSAYLTASTSSATVTFTGSSTSIGWTSNNLILNAPVYFTTTVSLTSPFVDGTIYYVQATGANSISVSSTPGSSALTAGSAGTGTHTGTQPSVWDLSIARINGNTVGIVTQVQ